MKMRTFRTQKLWQGKIAATLKAKGCIVHAEQLTDDQYDTALRNKRIEVKEIAAT